jgi:hypothetical protein
MPAVQGLTPVKTLQLFNKINAHLPTPPMASTPVDGADGHVDLLTVLQHLRTGSATCRPSLQHLKWQSTITVECHGEALNMTEEHLVRTKAILVAQEGKYRRSAMRWKFAYRFLLVVSALLASAAAIISKLSFLDDKALSADWSSMLAGTAAVLTTLLAALDFESNFRINRRSRHQVQILLLDAEKSEAVPDKLLEGLQQVVSRRTHDLDKAD